MDIRDRLLEKVVINENGCWEWNAATRKTGYGCIKYNGKLIDSHRMSYIIHKGEIPKGMLVCHSCDNRKCINPNHLFLGTYQDNYDDAVIKGRINPDKTHLRRHPSINSYDHYGCRCPECKKIKSDYRKDYLKRKSISRT